VIAASEQNMLAEDLGSFTHDPLGAVIYGFPWGEGDLSTSNGPRTWQKNVLEAIGEHLANPETRFMPFKCAVSSGHGIGKSALVSWIIWWGLSTFEDCKIIVTANTKGQLDTKTQPEVSKWFRLAVNADWFDVHVASISVKEPQHDRTWRADFNPWSEENSSAFAGAHNQGKRIIIIMDEASEIASIISAEVGRGALTDENTEILWFKFGNPTLNSGDFFDCTHGDQRHRWKSFIIDSREVEGTNKQEIAEWEQDYGEDSDFFRVRVRGLPPRAASGQYIDQERIQQAQTRTARSLPDDPLVAGVDFAWGGSDHNVVRFRKGLDARSIPPIKVEGKVTRDPAVMVGRLADVLNKTYNGEKLAMLFFDSAGIAAPVEARLRALGHKNIMVVNFGADSPDPKAAYFRDFMWMKMHDWLEHGAIDKDPALASDLAKPLLVSDKLNRIKLEPKDVMFKRLAKMGITSGSPDDGDALALTFAHKVMPPVPETPKEHLHLGRDEGQSWMG
jgi:hypothetical protein